MRYHQVLPVKVFRMLKFPGFHKEFFFHTFSPSYVDFSLVVFQTFFLERTARHVERSVNLIEFQCVRVPMQENKKWEMTKKNIP